MREKNKFCNNTTSKALSTTLDTIVSLQLLGTDYSVFSNVVTLFSPAKQKTYLHLNPSRCTKNHITLLTAHPLSVRQRLKILHWLLHLLRQQIPLGIQQISGYHRNRWRPWQFAPVHTLQTAALLLQLVLERNPILETLVGLCQFLVDVGEADSVARFRFPTVAHQFADERWTVFRWYEHDALEDQFDDFLVRVAVVGLFAEAVDFPEDDAVGPDVRFEGESAVEDAFGGHPADWEQTRATDLVTMRERKKIEIKSVIRA